MTTDTQAALATPQQVAQAGAAAGYWTIINERQNDLNGVVTHVDVESPHGHRFYISGPNYSSKGTIGIGLCHLGDRGGLCVDFSDVTKYGTERPTARESQKKAPEVIAKGLNRRIVQDPEVVAACGAMRTRLETMQAQRAALLGHLAQVAALGFSVREPDAKTYYSAKASRYDSAKQQSIDVEIFHTGRVRVTLDTTADNLAGVLAAA